MIVRQNLGVFDPRARYLYGLGFQPSPDMGVKFPGTNGAQPYDPGELVYGFGPPPALPAPPVPAAASGFNAWMKQAMIPGVPNMYLVLGMGFFMLLTVSRGRRR